MFSFKNDISTILDVPEPEPENGKALFFCWKAFSFILFVWGQENWQEKSNLKQ